MAETLSVTDMLPNKFEPKRNYRWVLAIEGIDSFLITKTARPTINISDKKIDFIFLVNFSNESVSLLDAYLCVIILLFSENPIIPAESYPLFCNKSKLWRINKLIFLSIFDKAHIIPHIILF